MRGSDGEVSLMMSESKLFTTSTINSDYHMRWEFEAQISNIWSRSPVGRGHETVCWEFVKMRGSDGEVSLMMSESKLFTTSTINSDYLF